MKDRPWLPADSSDKGAGRPRASLGRSMPQGRRHQGAVALTVALSLLFLLGFMGVALDFGRLFVIRAELQTAVDACALAAASELDGRADALTRAGNAGVRAGNLNAVNFQSSSWAGRPQLSTASLQFLDRDAQLTTQPAQARYARCTHTHQSVGAWLMPALRAFSGDARMASADRVGAQALATRRNAQTACPLPVAFRPTSGASAPSYGLTVGQWVTLVGNKSLAPGGQIGWANLDGSVNAAETERELLGYCGVRVGDRLGTPGAQASVTDAWNLRFGIQKNNPPPEAAALLDRTGYAYTAKNWPSQFGAYRGATPAGAHATAANYLTKSAVGASCADTGARLNDCESITGLQLSGGSKTLVPPGPAYASQTRVVIVPVVNANAQVTDYLCMLMLQPMSSPMINLQFEFIGNAANADSPCLTSGLPGGNLGPLVATLVR